MGCGFSRFDQQQESSGSARTPQRQCELRKSSLKQALGARTSLAAAHARYVQSISATALLFKQFADGEFHGGAPESGLPQQQQVSSSAFSSFDSDESSTSSSENIAITTTTKTVAHAMKLWSTPAKTVTVDMSRNLYHRSGDGDGDDDEDDAMFFRPPPPPPGSYQRGSSPPPMPPPSGGDYLDIFQSSVPRRRVLGEEEDLPALEDEEEPKKQFHDSEIEPEDKAGRENVGNPMAAASLSTEEESDASGSSIAENIEKEEIKIPEGAKEEEEEGAPSAEASKVVEDGGSASQVLSSPMQLVDVIKEQFMRASEAGKPLLRMLEARRVPGNEKGFSDHSSRLLSALSLGHWSPRSFSPSKDDFDRLVGEGSGMAGSHAATLDRLYAWEKKLLEEVKSWEALNVEFGKKRKLLRNLDAKGAKPEAIDKTRASMKGLETQISVALQAIEASSASIHKITEEEVLPQLMELLEGFMEMWRGMHESHKNQLNVIQLSRFFQNPVLEATSTSHRNVTLQLESTFTTLHTSLSGLVAAQKQYIKSLNEWVQYASVPPPSEGNTRRPSHRKGAPCSSKIQFLCDKWNKALNEVTTADGTVTLSRAVEAMTAAIKSFAEMLRDIGSQQAEEIRIQKRADGLAKELSKKIASVNSLEKKCREAPSEKQEALSAQIAEKRTSVEALKAKVQDEKQKFTRAIHKTRLLTLNSLQEGLPKLFKELEGSAAACMNGYDELYNTVKNYTPSN